MMLDKAGIIEDSPDLITMNVCADCFTALSKENCVPRFALTNNLYHGKLPKYFEDLTWVKEKICAIYSTMAHVTRLFQSSDLLQLKVFHGNICAHDMNVVSTASVLPRTPADNKIWTFLVWLKHHNRLYSDIPLEPGNLNLYPADDMLPGLSDQSRHV
ncbi:uncharacterized protein EDB91DRAFT_1240318 [Suillus paluster]|uniref:uncharacterized protein n=1 Tax=Suillus paluster TaxID=48578 RepID=UPI001B86A0F3|nr:uncharacterized protein EDB91DRAFT_1240318 [Suillus paluster]KAG1721365.1 hypothetical protein EDB91DRAFT_1240318 [Suillus paluster]